MTWITVRKKALPVLPDDDTGHDEALWARYESAVATATQLQETLLAAAAETGDFDAATAGESTLTALLTEKTTLYMVLGEFVVHGWDLARATGQASEWDDEVLSSFHRDLELTAEQGRAMGVYRDRVEVPDTPSMLDKILGMTGRDPVMDRPTPDEGRRHPCRSSPAAVSLSDRPFGRSSWGDWSGTAG